MKQTAFCRVTTMAVMAWLVAMLGTGTAQEWVRLREEGANFYDIQRSFYKEWEGRTPGEGMFEGQGEEGGYTQFKRWEYWMEPRVYPSGILPEPGQYARAFRYYLQKRGARFTDAATLAFVATAIPSANWISLGPSSWVPTLMPTLNSNTPGLGRISAIAVHPNDPNTIFLGTPAGGLWQTTPGGTWSTKTDNFEVLGVSSIVIDPSNPKVMYMATGDNDAAVHYVPSVGVLKSIDGGGTWFRTQLQWDVTKARKIYKLIIHPTKPNILLAATSDGILKTTDAGEYWWPQMTTTSWKDIEFKPGDPTIVYAADSKGFWRSTDTGDTWTQITKGVPTQANRISIGVSAAKPDYVYLLASIPSNSTNSSFLGVYRSTEKDVSFTKMSLPTAPNLLGYKTDGSDANTGQGWYTLALAVSPNNAEEIYVGGVNIWKSTDGGISWNNNKSLTYWEYGGPAKSGTYVHADVHHIEFHGPALYAGTDGGFFRSLDNGDTWEDLSAGLAISQFYRIGSDPNSANLVYGGAQDNAISCYDASTKLWKSLLSGDGTECIVDRTNPNIVYISTEGGQLQRSSDGGDTFSYIMNDIAHKKNGVWVTNEEGAWVTPYVMDPVTNTTLYVGYVNVWRTTNSGTKWENLSNGAVGTGSFVDLQVAVAPAPSNAKYIYGVKTNKVYCTKNGGDSWTDITAGLPPSAYTHIAVSSVDPEKIWITLSGDLHGNKVYASTNAGATWTNYSGFLPNFILPNLPFSTIVYQNNGGTDALYAGADAGVWYRDATMSDWELYETGLPNAPIQELEVHENSGTLRAATFGRGLWQTPLVPPPGAALAFDGVDDYVSSNVFTTATNNVTMEAWVKWAGSTGGEQVIFCNGNGNGINYGIRLIDNDFISTMGIGGFVRQPVRSQVKLKEGTWTHLALVGKFVPASAGVPFNTIGWVIYKDGDPTPIFGRGSPAWGIVAEGPNSRIGGSTSGGGFFKGTICEFRFWNVARSPAEIKATMNCQLTGTEPGLVAYYKFNEGYASSSNNAGVTTLMDFTGGHNNGTLNNFALTGANSNWVAPGAVQNWKTCTTPPPPPPVALAATIPVTANTNALFSARVSGDDRAFPRSAHTYAVTTDAGKPSYRWTVTNGTIVGDNTNRSVQVEAGDPESPLQVEVSVTDGATKSVAHASKRVTVPYPFPLRANAGSNRSIILGTPTTLGASPSATGGMPPLVYAWSPTTGLNNPNVANPIAQVISNTTYTLTVTDGFNATSTDQVTLTTKANLALNKRARASSAKSVYPPGSAVDSSASTYWQSGVLSRGTNAWWRVDLGAIYNIDHVVINWPDNAYAKQYKIQVSNNPASGIWKTVHTDNAGNGGMDDVTFSPKAGRYVRILMTKHNQTAERLNEVYVGATDLVASVRKRQ